MSQEQVLLFLRQSGTSFVSGEQLSGRLGLSRAAVWKAVDALRKAGYTVEARTGLGYRLTQTPDALTEREIRQHLGIAAQVGNTLICLDTVDSTNTYAKRLALEGGADGTVVVADCQSNGRGRLGRRFESPAGMAVYLTALLRPALSPEALLPVTALAAVALCDAVEEVCGVRPGIKWTNDLVLGGRKLCGILTELSLEGETGQVQSLVVGAGINVLQRAGDFGGEAEAVATSLFQATGQVVSRPQLAAAEIRCLDRLYSDLLTGQIARYLACYRRDCVTLGKQVRLLRFDETGREAFALDVDEQFGLVVRYADGTVDTVRSGEASVRGLYGYVQ